MLKFRKTIAGKLIAAFLILFGFIFINTIYTYSTLNESKRIDLSIRESANPLLDGIGEFTMLATQSKMLAINWVYLQSDEADKNSLKQLHKSDYPLLKVNLNKLLSAWNDTTLSRQIQQSFIRFEEILTSENEIMTTLVTFENYEDPMIKLMAEESIQSKIVPLSEQLMVQLAETKKKINKDVISIKDELQDSFNNTKQIVSVFTLIILLIGILIIFFSFRQIILPIKRAGAVLETIAQGIIPESITTKISGDEVGEMLKATNVLIKNSKETSSFAAEIGKGNYERSYTLLSDKDTMGKALIEMRNNLKKVSEDDKQRNWATTGLAKFGEILRLNNDNLEMLGNNIISNLVKYLKANQGGLFIINDSNNEDIHLELIACYAFERKKHITKQIRIGEGLVGQVWQEGELIYLTDVPNDYIHITSGLGEANPRCILIMPLKINEQIFGVIEIASFNHLEKHEIDFVQKLSESIASTISTAKINERTKCLLQESQQQSEELKTQEEEMKQNMEEMSATHEEMQRKEKDYLDQIEALQKKSKE